MALGLTPISARPSNQSSDHDLSDALARALESELESEPTTITREIIERAISVYLSNPTHPRAGAQYFLDAALAAHSYALIAEAVEAALAPRHRRKRRSRSISGL